MIHKAQEIFTKAGYDVGAIDGILGKITKSVVSTILEGSSWSKSPPNIRIIAAAQTILEWSHYAIGGVDGVWGPKTQRAYESMISTAPKQYQAPTNLTDTELAELKQVHPDMVKWAISVKDKCLVDFRIFDGIRTAPEQNVLYRRKASQLDGYRKKSNHQIQDTGFGHAVDLVPFINGKLDWDWVSIYEIAATAQIVAKDQDVQIRWGGCWQVINGLSGAPENWVSAYVKRKQLAGKRAFNDGPHFELYGY